MALLAVNFHYIGGPPGPFPAIYPVSAEALAAQLEALGREFTFVSGADLLAAVEGKKALPPSACAITFDDGLRSQVEVALPVLDRLRVPALFFVCGQPVAERRALSVHKIHHISAHREPDRLLEALEAFYLREKLPRLNEAEALIKAHAMYRYDGDRSALTKWRLNYELEAGLRDRFTDSVFAELVSSEESWCTSAYLDADQIRMLGGRGYLGNHTYGHLPLRKLSDAALSSELTRSQKALQAITGAPVPFISYPYGGENAVSSRESLCAAKAGFRVGFTMERAVNLSLTDPLLLARLDTNDAVGGKRPLPALAPRSRYLQEATA